MSRAKLFNMVKSRGEKPVGRNPFDLTNRHVYSQKAAKITPIKALHTYPDDFFDVSVSEFTQNKVPMNTAAFLSGKKELLAYFVPYNTIWHNFNQYQATREDPESTLLYNQGIAFEPRMRLYDLYLRALQFGFITWLYNKYQDVYAILRYHATRPTVEQGITIPELVTYMKNNQFQHQGTLWDEYKSIAFTLSKQKNVEYFNDSLETLHQEHFQMFFRTPERFSDISLFDTATNMFGNFVWCDYVQKLDMLGYGNIYPILHDMINDLNNYVDDAILNNSDSQCVVSGNITYTWKGQTIVLNQDFNYFDALEDVALEPIFEDILYVYYKKIFNLTTNGSFQATQYEYLNVYSFFAYNKCFYDYMRNPYFDTDYSPYNYNCDFINGSSLEGSIISLGQLPLRWFHLECHQWKKDMFTGVLPDNQLGQVSELILQGSMSAKTEQPSNTAAPTITIAGHGANPVLADGYDQGVSILLTPESVNVPTDVNRINQPHYHNVAADVNSSLNVLALKRAEAIQQYRQDLMRAGNRTNDIFQQIYGSTPKSQLEESPYFIEVASNDINVNPIISTAQTGDGINQALGDIAARVTISGSDLHFKFSTKDFGVIILLSYIVPDSFYNSYRIDPFNMHLDQESHGLPYFQNLGLQPVFGSMLSNMGSLAQRNRILGYAPPYIEFKTDIDLVHGDFVDLFQPRVNANDTDTDYQGEMSHWVVARTDMQQEDAVSLRNFYIDPRILDNVFTFNAGDDYSTDHFFTYSVVKVNAVRAFSELGLPRF